MTIVLILQLSESSRSRVSLLHSAQCNVFVFVFVYLSFFPFCFCLGRRSSLEQNQFQSTISIRYCVDEDDDDSGGRTQRDCLTLAAPVRRPSQTEAKTNTSISQERLLSDRPCCKIKAIVIEI